ncbi:hypothetical protein VNI00_005348 [Paramarasmius palmivorus]|uniref:HNH nuclease domain-containing protein n=1 Tax=Paramarasmius palmivorus TaxID=297713 RepID=A0AAW0DBG6_9AGAR
MAGPTFSIALKFIKKSGCDAVEVYNLILKIPLSVIAAVTEYPVRWILHTMRCIVPLPGKLWDSNGNELDKNSHIDIAEVCSLKYQVEWDNESYIADPLTLMERHSNSLDYDEEAPSQDPKFGEDVELRDEFETTLANGETATYYWCTIQDTRATFKYTGGPKRIGAEAVHIVPHVKNDTVPNESMGREHVHISSYPSDQAKVPANSIDTTIHFHILDESLFFDYMFLGMFNDKTLWNGKLVKLPPPRHKDQSVLDCIWDFHYGSTALAVFAVQDEEYNRFTTFVGEQYRARGGLSRPKDDTDSEEASCSLSLIDYIWLISAQQREKKENILKVQSWMNGVEHSSNED